MTVKDQFIEIEKKEGYIKALETLNEWLTTKATEYTIDLELENEILDFGDYFVDNFEDETYDERIEHFGEDDAFILRFYDILVEKSNEEGEFLEECEEILTTLERTDQQELEKVAEILQFYPEKKNLYIEYTSGHVFSCELEETLNREQELELKGILSKAIVQGGVLLIEMQESKIATAILFKDKTTFTISKNGIKKIHNINPYTGERVKQKGFKYIEANNLTMNILNKKGEV